MDDPDKPYRRVLLKLSGEILRGEQTQAAFGAEAVARIAGELKDALQGGCQLAIVVGGGNIFRGATSGGSGIDRPSGDQIGMLATVANGLALRSVLEGHGLEVCVLSAIPIPGVVELFERRVAEAALAAGQLLICVAGTGNPYFTTDTAAALRALQIGADALFKGTKVDGVYSADPMKDPTAKRYEQLTHGEMIAKQLGVMDVAAAALCGQNDLKVVVFDMTQAGTLARVLRGEPVGTVIAD